MKSIVSVEIAGDYIRATEIGNPLTPKPTLIRYGEIRIPEGLATESEVADPQNISEKIKELWESAKFGTKDVALGISGRQIIVKPMVSKFTDLKLIKSTLSFEAAEVLPSAMDKTVLDFYPINVETDDKGKSQTNGLLLISKIEATEKIIKAFDLAGLNVNFVDYSPFGLVRAMHKANPELGDVMLVNVKTFSTDILAVRNGVPQLVRVISNGLSTRKKASGRRAANPLAHAFNAEAPAPNAVSPVETIIGGIRSTINFYSNAGFETNKIVLSGEGALSEELQLKIQALLQLDVSVLTLEDVIGAPEKQENRDSTIESLAITTVGVGMRGLK